MSLALWHWHIEISSKCTLKCPRCPRWEVADGLINTELELEFFKSNFTEQFIHDNVEKITFCGDDGGPIYARDLISVIEYIKGIKPVKFSIVTNGSYKSDSWWTALAGQLDSNDTIHFSLDGWNQQSNERYRVNSNWGSILAGIAALRKNSEVFMTWDAIAFSFNQDNIASMRELAAELGFDNFQLTKSTKYNKIYNSYPETDSLQPRDEFISDNFRFQRIITNLSGRTESIVGHATNLALFKGITVINEVLPLCNVGNKGLFINSRGNFFPCCWVANRYSHNKDWESISKKFNLKENSLPDVVKDNYWNKEFRSFTWAECKTKCSSSVVTEAYATEW